MEDFALNKCDFIEIKEYLEYDGQCDFDVDRLNLHRKMFFDIIKNEKSNLDGLTKISIFLQERHHIRGFVPEYALFIRLLLTYPQSVCVAERSFSDLRRLKTYIRSNQTQQKTNDLAILHVHRDIINNVDLDEIVDEFISRNPIRRKTFALKNETH